MVEYLVALSDQSHEIPIPVGKRLPRGWQSFAIPPARSGEGIRLSWKRQAEHVFSSPVLLRMSVALDEREEKLVGVFLPDGSLAGTLDIRFAHLFQPFETKIEAAAANRMVAEGCQLRLLKGEQPLWLFHDPHLTRRCDALMPHLQPDGTHGSLDDFRAQFSSLASLQFFGWQEGCVLDGLLDLERIYPGKGYAETARSHLAQFFDPDGSLVAEDDFSRPADGRIYGIEATLPYAALAKLAPAHPALSRVADYWRTTRDRRGAVVDGQASYLRPGAGKALTAEGNLTLAYPMAVLSHLPGNDWLADLALEQLRFRQQLFDGTRLALRRFEDGSTAFTNWARGAAWYLLGLARTLSALDDMRRPIDLVHEFKRAAEWEMGWQLPGGLWSCFIDEPALPPDTSGSAGIAAALALGARHGWLDNNARSAARRTLEALTVYLAPDGFLRGVAQVNKGGEALQRGPYRVISQMAMGLMAQLMAALEGESI